ncbi:hypothetical protein NE237_024427 [Protea cynaroides]|uniref:Uncharacterized protein n=1 Tax=Protea cynaroides TaxID=273540 RepID=A0A9Q0K710_9MAGN|nr:hypothetical protein NE237_024427 [Protea cynaroides]
MGLESAGLLRELANYLDAHIPNIELIASVIGVVSAIIDNVPLQQRWECSAAGVAYMSVEKGDFFWYLWKVNGFTFACYTAGIVAYLATHNLHLSPPTALAQVPFFSGS